MTHGLIDDNQKRSQLNLVPRVSLLPAREEERPWKRGWSQLTQLGSMLSLQSILNWWYASLDFAYAVVSYGKIVRRFSHGRQVDSFTNLPQPPARVTYEGGNTHARRAPSRGPFQLNRALFYFTKQNTSIIYWCVRAELRAEFAIFASRALLLAQLGHLLSEQNFFLTFKSVKCCS